MSWHIISDNARDFRTSTITDIDDFGFHFIVPSPMTKQSLEMAVRNIAPNAPATR